MENWFSLEEMEAGKLEWYMETGTGKEFPKEYCTKQKYLSKRR